MYYNGMGCWGPQHVFENPDMMNKPLNNDTLGDFLHSMVD